MSAGNEPTPGGGHEAADALARLASLVVDDAARRVRRESNRASAEARQLVADAEEHVEALRRAAKALGRTRGSAAEAALQREADREVETVLAMEADERVADPDIRPNMATDGTIN